MRTHYTRVKQYRSNDYAVILISAVMIIIPTSWTRTDTDVTKAARRWLVWEKQKNNQVIL